MRPRNLVAIAVAAFAMVAFALVASIWPATASAAGLVVVDEQSVADFPTGITLSLDFLSPRPVDTAYVLYTLANQDVSTEVEATLGDGDASSASVTIEMATSFVPAGVDLTYRWRLVSADESEEVTPPKTVMWEDDRFAWQRSASADVEVFDYDGGDDLRQKVLASAQETVDRLSSEFAVWVDHPIRIWVYASKKDFDGTLAANSTEWSAGAAYPDLQLILAVIPKNRPSELGRIIPHEISHQVLGLATANPYNVPAAWLDEGLAVVNQTNGTTQMAGLVRNAKREGRMLPLASLTNGFPYDADDAGLAYAESFGVVTYLIDTYGRDALARIAAAYRAGNTHDDAFRAAIRRDVAQLDAEWQATIDTSASSFAPGALARALIYGAPSLAVVTYLVVRTIHRPVDRFAHEEAAP